MAVEKKNKTFLPTKNKLIGTSRKAKVGIKPMNLKRYKQWNIYNQARGIAWDKTKTAECQGQREHHSQFGSKCLVTDENGHANRAGRRWRHITCFLFAYEQICESAFKKGSREINKKLFKTFPWFLLTTVSYFITNWRIYTVSLCGYAELPISDINSGRWFCSLVFQVDLLSVSAF